jgi:hypothetical protein
VTTTTAARVGAALAAAWLLVLVVADLLLPDDVAPSPLFVLSPLIAAAVMSVRATAGFALAGIVLLVWSGWHNEVWDTTQQWIRLLDVVLVGAAAVLIAVVRIRREQRFGHMSNIADVAQRAILPILPKSTAGVRVQARYQSAVEDAVVGGDLYDVSLVGGHVRFLVGDVKGKGVAAVEQAARVIRAFRQAAAIEPTLPDVARHMDDYLTPFLGEEDFATALLVDASHRDHLTLLSCGHPPPLLIRKDGSAEFAEATPGLPLGLGAGGELEVVRWEVGDRILLYTDGLSEARDAEGRFLSLLDLAPALTGTPHEAALDEVFERIRDHVPGGDLGDDCALVLLENTAGLGTGAVRRTSATSVGTSPTTVPSTTATRGRSRSMHPTAGPTANPPASTGRRANV